MAAYRGLLGPSAQINMAFMVAPEDWGGVVPTQALISTVIDSIKSDPNVGIGVWHIGRVTNSFDYKGIIATVQPYRNNSGPMIPPPVIVPPIVIPPPVVIPPPIIATELPYITVYEVTTGKQVKIYVTGTPTAPTVTLYSLETGAPIQVVVKNA